MPSRTQPLRFSVKHRTSTIHSCVSPGVYEVIGPTFHPCFGPLSPPLLYSFFERYRSCLGHPLLLLKTGPDPGAYRCVSCNSQHYDFSYILCAKTENRVYLLNAPYGWVCRSQFVRVMHKVFATNTLRDKIPMSRLVICSSDHFPPR